MAIVLQGIEVKEFMGNVSGYIVVSIEEVGYWAPNIDDAYRLIDEIEADTGENAYVYHVTFSEP